MTDLYDVVGVDRAADVGQIKKAFRRKAKKAHPDTGGSAAEFAKLNRAYLVLVDPARREKYDRTGTIEEEAVDNTHVEAMQIIQQIMDQLVEQAGDRIEVDVVASMRDAIDGRVREIKAEMAALQRKAKKLKRLAGKFHKDSGENILRRMVETKIDHVERGISAAERALGSFAKAKALLEGYRFDRDQPEQAVWMFSRGNSAYWGSGGAATSTGTFG